VNRHFAGKLVQAEALGGRRALAIGYHREALSAIRGSEQEFDGRPVL
jgi:hypothetical protein